jgi:4-amino-4-deoxy-L-arabinose transferase-like glycosyltransferase
MACALSWLERYRTEASIFIVAIALRLALLALIIYLTGAGIEGVVGRNDGYYDISKNLLEGNGFSRALRPPFTPDPLRTPIYPLFIATVLGAFGTYWAVVLFQILAGSLIPVLGMQIAHRILPLNSGAALVGVLLAVEPLSVLYSFVFFTETIFICFFFLSLLLLFGYLERADTWRIAGSALLLGMATLTKPTTQYLLVFVALLVVWRGRKSGSRQVWAHVVGFLLVFLVSISPWLYRNYRTFGMVGLSAQPAFNLYRLLVPTVLAIEHGTTIKDEQERLSKRDATDENDIDLSSSPRFIARSLEILKGYPVSLVKAAGMSLITFFTHDGLLAVLKHAGYEVSLRLPGGAVVSAFRSPWTLVTAIPGLLDNPAVFILLGRVAWVLVTTAFFLGVFRFLRREGPSANAVWALFLVAYFAITTVAVGFGIYARYRMPVNVFIFAFALYAVKGLGEACLPSASEGCRARPAWMPWALSIRKVRLPWLLGQQCAIVPNGWGGSNACEGGGWFKPGISWLTFPCLSRRQSDRGMNRPRI